MCVWKSRTASSAKKEKHMVLQVCVTRHPIQGWGRSQPRGRFPQEAMLGVEVGGKSIPRALRGRSRVYSRRKNRKKVLVVGAQSEAGKLS